MRFVAHSPCWVVLRTISITFFIKRMKEKQSEIPIVFNNASLLSTRLFSNRIYDLDALMILHTRDNSYNQAFSYNPPKNFRAHRTEFFELCIDFLLTRRTGRIKKFITTLKPEGTPLKLLDWELSWHERGEKVKVNEVNLQNKRAIDIF